MADPLTSAITLAIVKNLTSPAIKEIGRIWGFNDHLQALYNTFTALQAEVVDVEMLRKKTESQKNWLRRLKDVAYDVEDILDLIQYEDLKRRAESSSDKGKLFPSSGLRFRIKMANRLKNVRKKLDAITSDKNMFTPREGVVENRFGVMNESGHTGSLVLESEIYGRDEDKEIILVNLLHDNVINQNHLSVLAICGMGGLGKTTLAQLVYNDERVKMHFDLRMWVCVSDDFHVERLVRRIFECVNGGPCNISEFDLLQSRLRESLMGKKFLLILDDVWNDNPLLWDKLRQTLTCDSKGSAILVTTRNKEVAMKMDAISSHDIGCLSEEHSWALFVQRAFSNGNANENLVAIGKRIVKKCQGVPLSIKAIGSMMLGITSESNWVAVEKNGIWDQLENNNVATPALRLSYYNLELQLRQCFAYCCIFPKDYVMKENHLIQLWIANGFIPSNDQNDVFSIGQSIFRKLAWRSFFQEIKKNWAGNVTCKMHDLMHDLASSIMEDETYVMECNMENNFPKMVRHLYFDETAFDDFMEKYVKFRQPTYNSLRSLFIVGGYNKVRVNNIISLLSKQHFLRVLHLPIPVNLSKLFGKFKHLKHLVISCHIMAMLPNSITSLYNLQTLKLIDSGRLLKLPKYLRVLKKLCCLEMDRYYSLLCSPPGLGELACLCRLPIFIVGENTSQQIGQLEKLNLGGNLCIKGLDNVSNIEDARSAKLINKMNLTTLTLVWMKKGKRKHGERVEEVLEGLQPHHNLEEIEIQCYPGSKFSNWMGNTTFTNLKKVRLYGCENCVCLPALGKLPSLTHLDLEGFNSIRSLGIEFLGDAECSFPALTTLNINGMSNLKNWSILDSVMSFRRLTNLSLTYCPKLERLPSVGKLPSLTHLCLRGFDSIRSLGVEFLGDAECSFPVLETLDICEMSNLEDWSIPDSVRRFPRLTKLSLASCPKLGRLPSFEKLTSVTNLTLDNILSLKSSCVELLRDLEFSFHALTWLDISRMSNLEEWGIPELKRLPSLLSLEKLNIRDSSMDFECQEIHKPPIIISFNCLKSLRISRCDNLRTFPAVILDDMPFLESLEFQYCEKLKPLMGVTLKQVSSLQALTFNSLPEMQGLPECMQQLTSLTRLDVWYCDECFLPDWFGSLKSLSDLRIGDCKNMKMFPDSFSGLKSLTRLLMYEVAEEVKERCKKAEGKDWQNISHIPYIVINRETIQDLRVRRQVR